MNVHKQQQHRLRLPSAGSLRIAGTFLAVWCIVFLAGPAFGQQADEIIRSADEAFELDRLYSRSALHVTRNGREQAPQVMETYESEAEDGTSRSLSVFLSPPRVEGTAYLMIGDDLWVRFASTGRVRKMSSSARKNSASGSDFSYADMGEGSDSFTSSYDATLDGEESIDGVACFRIELTPNDGEDLYGRIVLWISKDEYRYRQIEFYEDGAAIKRMYLDDYRLVDDVGYPFRITMHSLVEDSVSEIVTEEIEADSPKVEERYFSAAYLRSIR